MMIYILWAIIGAIFCGVSATIFRTFWCQAQRMKHQLQGRIFFLNLMWVNKMALIKFKFILASVGQKYIFSRFVLYLQSYWREHWGKAHLIKHNMKFDSNKLVSNLLRCMVLWQIPLSNKVDGRCWSNLQIYYTAFVFIAAP